MKIDNNSSQPIFMQIAQRLEDAIFNGLYKEESQIPSTTELSTLLNINPQTVLKGMTLLVNDGIIYKKRGVGMFVSTGALKMVKDKHMESYYDSFIKPMVREAKSLGLSHQQISDMIEKVLNYY